MNEYNTTIKHVITTRGELWINSIIHENTPDVMYFEFLEGPGINTITTQKVSSFNNLNTYKQNLDDDGLFMYYCLQVKTKESLIRNNPQIDLSIPVYCDYINGRWVLYNGDEIVDTNEKLSVILENKTEDNVGFAIKPIFSICHLHKCLEDKLRANIFDTLKTCDQYPMCNKDSYDDFIRNFLFSTVFILRQLICQERYAEATRILDSINRCEGICNNTRSNFNKCNCCD